MRNKKKSEPIFDPIGDAVLAAVSEPEALVEIESPPARSNLGQKSRLKPSEKRKSVKTEKQKTTEIEKASPPKPKKTPSKERRSEPTAERFDKALRTPVTRKEEMRVKKRLASLSAAAGISIPFSSWSRAFLDLLELAEDDVERLLQRARLERPPNDDRRAMTDHEHQLAELLLKSFFNLKVPLERN